MADILEPEADTLATNTPPSNTIEPSSSPTLSTPGMSFPEIVSLQNFPTVEWTPWKTPFLNSPRSVEICKLNGVTVDDMLPKPYEYYLDLVQQDRMNVVATKMEDIAMLRHERGEISRRKLIRKLKGER